MTLCDVREEAVEKALEGISRSVGKLIEKGMVVGPEEAVMSPIHKSCGLMEGDGSMKK